MAVINLSIESAAFDVVELLRSCCIYNVRQISNSRTNVPGATVSNSKVPRTHSAVE